MTVNHKTISVSVSTEQACLESRNLPPTFSFVTLSHQQPTNYVWLKQ